MKNSYTLTETYKLPSRGKLYPGCPDTVTLRSMTTEEEMRRLSHTDTPYKTLCKIIDDCILEDLPISTYDMCIGDYQFLLYKLRTVSYGPEYLNGSLCPICKHFNVTPLNLDELRVIELTEDTIDPDMYVVNLPRSGKTITLNYRTPRILDAIEADQEAFQKRAPENELDTTLLFKLKHSIKLVDGQHYDAMKLEAFIRKLPAMDMNILDRRIAALDDKFGIDTSATVHCENPECGVTYPSSFRITSEFFRPTVR